MSSIAYSQDKVAVVMVPLPAQGHLNQLLHLSRLISTRNITVYYVGASTHLTQIRSRVIGWDPSAITNMHFHEFPTPTFENPLPNPNQTDTKFPTHIIPSLTSSIHLREPLYSYIKKLSTTFRKLVVIYDSLMAYVVQDIGSIPNVHPYCFRSVSAFCVYLFHWNFSGRGTLPPEAQVLNESPLLEGCFPPEFNEFRMLQYNAKKVFLGDIYNSNRAIEGPFLDLLAKERATGGENVWALGPFHPVTIPTIIDPLSAASKQIMGDANPRHKCLEWLDNQGENSVIFISFGTTSSVSSEEIEEIAFGLERSEQKFLWVLRDADKGDIFSGEVRTAMLPEGFEDRVKERGFVVRDWAPQLEILRHANTGGFMSHCGWNSSIESISMGVPMATWPMHSDQPGNAMLINKVLRTGVEVREWSQRDEVVSRFAVEKAVRRLMASAEGDEIRERATKLGEAVRESVMEGGTTCKEFDSFITKIIT